MSDSCVSQSPGPPNDSSLCVDIQDLTIEYRGALKPALQNLSLKIAKGKFFGLLGPNGAGKTTLISFLCGQLDGQYKSALIMGHDRKAIRDYKRGLGYAPQEIALYPMLSARENLKFFAKIMNVNKTEIERVLDWVGLTDRSEDLVGELSGGMKRRLNLGVALLNQPKLLILDEPTVGVDPQSRNFIFERIQELKKDGTTVIYSTHYLEEVARLCDDVGILNHGQIVICGSKESVIGSEDLERRYLQLTGTAVEQ